MLRALVVASLLAALGPLPARAQTADDSTDAEAHSLFEAGHTAFAAGRFPDALGYFRHSYELSHRPQLLYNIGQCEDRLRHDAEALSAFEQFLAEVTEESPTRSEVESRVTFLREALARAAAETTTTETTTTETPVDTTPPPDLTPAPPVDEGPGPAPWIVVGVGGAVLAAGIVLVVLGLGDVDRVSNVADGTTYASVRDADQRAPILTGVGWALLGVGAAAAIGGIVWGVAGGGSHGDAVTLRLTPGMLTLSGTF